MKFLSISILLLLSFFFLNAQQVDTFLLHHALSKYDTIIYKRIIRFDEKDSLYHVRDYFENGQIQMEGTYSSFDKRIKEQYQCSYRTNVKEGLYKEWFKGGQLKFAGHYKNGLRHGLSTDWYKNGQKEEMEHWFENQLHGVVKYWTAEGLLQYESEYKYGLNQKAEKVDYPYITYLPSDYHSDTTLKWPLILFLHGGSARGTDTLDLYDYGPFDQIYRGREFPFIIVAPQIPKHLRWSTDNWFEHFFEELIQSYNIDTNRVYLTGASLGASGTWYLAVKHPDKFAAIAPMSGFTRHIAYIRNNIERLKDMPVWAFHGKLDKNVHFEETEFLVNKLEKINKKVKFTIEPEVGHWIHHLVYPGEALYDWFLQHRKDK